MIDWHSHILPRMDDGSRDVEESIALLRMLSNQGADTVVATPHFFADDMSVTDFLRHRSLAYDSLIAVLPSDMPDIVLGAEVRYYPGISNLADLKNLCIENSNLLLLEMPMSKWTEYTARELEEISNTREIRLVLAHIERYLPMQSGKMWNRLYDSGIVMQTNASFFNEFKTRAKALSLLKNGEIHVIGSDCHSIAYRPPKLDKAYEIIRKKFKDGFVTQFNEYGSSLLNLNKTL